MRIWLRDKWIERNLTQSEVADMAGVDVTMISKIELGERRLAFRLKEVNS